MVKCSIFRLLTKANHGLSVLVDLTRKKKKKKGVIPVTIFCVWCKDIMRLTKFINRDYILCLCLVLGNSEAHFNFTEACDEGLSVSL